MQSTSAEQQALRRIFGAAVDSVSGAAAVHAAVSEDDFASEVYVVAIGKAASSMTLGACNALGDRLCRGLVLTKYDHSDAALVADPRLTLHESAHPVPDQASLAAGELLIEFISTLPAQAELLVLLSGGASALVESLPENMTLSDLSRVTDWLLGSGMDITQMNQVRRSLSCIKGGRLANYLNDARVRQYLISDVPGDRLQDIGSGPLALVETANQSRQQAGQQIPGWLAEFQRQVPPMPDASHTRLCAVESRIVASCQVAREVACRTARQMGFTVHEVAGDLHQEVSCNADMIASTLFDDSSAAGVYVWAGESTLSLPATPGRGGRNQHLAALLAARIAGQPWVLLCGATDGTDGPTHDAGGLVDGRSLQRGEALGLDIEAYLQAADSGNWLEAVNALLTTGPTGTNVMDLVIALKPAAQARSLRGRSPRSEDTTG